MVSSTPYGQTYSPEQVRKSKGYRRIVDLLRELPAPMPPDPEIDAAVAAVEAEWAQDPIEPDPQPVAIERQPRTRENSKRRWSPVLKAVIADFEERPDAY